MLTLILPLVTYPYLIKVLGAKNYGLVMWAWSISEIFIVFIKFGFDTLGVKLVSENRDNKLRLREVFSQITYVKIVLLLFSILIFIILLFSLDKINNNATLFLYFMIFIIFESMIPIWYFQGIENMKIMAILVSSVKLIFAFLVFLVIKEPSQYLYIPILYAIGSFLSDIISYYIIIFKDKVSLSKVNIIDTLSVLKESFYILFSNVGTVIRDRATIILIEKYLGLEIVAYFDLALKIVNILLTPFHMISQVLYPHIARTKDMLLFKKVLLIVILLSLVTISFFIYNLEWIVIMVNGEDNEILKHIMSWLIFIVPVGIISLLIGDNILIVFNSSKWILYSMISSIIVYASLFILTNIFYKLTLNEFIIFFLSYFVIEMLVRLYGSQMILKRKRNA
jgi:PST family polysaccharide transporter